MTDDDAFELSRRKALAGLGTIGVASAGAGLGTSAFFSDQETYENNVLQAGAIDLKVDWEEHYSDWSDDEAAAVSDIVMIDQDADADGDGDVDNDDLTHQVPDGYIGLPDAERPLIAIPETDVPSFQDATSIEAYPDSDDDGIQDPFREDEDFDECELLADTPEDLDPSGGTGLRTDNDDTVDANGNPKPLVSLTDIKPGDFGELTLSFHVCDNPGYVWLNGELVSASENGYTEPERKDPDETGDANNDGEDDRVELLDEIQTLLWYDEDGDNVYEPGGVGGQVDVGGVLDESGSMAGAKLDEAKDAAKALIDTLDADDNASGVAFESGASRPFDLAAMDSTGRSNIKSEIDARSAGGQTNLQGGVIFSTEDLLAQEDGYTNPSSVTGGAGAGAFNAVDTGPFGGATRNDEQVMVVLSDGVANRYYNNSGTNVSAPPDPSTSTDPQDHDATQAAVNAAAIAKDNGIRVFTVGFDLDALPDDGTQTLAENTLQEMASPGDFYTDVQQGELLEVINQIAQAVEGEECFWRGSLRQTLNLLDGKSADGTVDVNGGLGIPLDGMRDSENDYVEIDDSGSSPQPNAGDDPLRDCFVNSTTNDIGLAWYLPVDHANEIQTDSVTFDLGFYTEQCRHNDGAGMDPVDGDPNNPEPNTS